MRLRVRVLSVVTVRCACVWLRVALPFMRGTNPFSIALLLPISLDDCCELFRVGAVAWLEEIQI